MVLPRERESLPRTGQHSPSLLLSLPPNSYGGLKPKPAHFTKHKETNQERWKKQYFHFWRCLHFSLRLLYTNLLILYNIDFSRRDMMLMDLWRISTWSYIYFWTLSEWQREYVTTELLLHFLWVMSQEPVLSKSTKCVSSWQNNIFRIFFFPMDEKVTAIIYWEFLKGINLISLSQKYFCHTCDLKIFQLSKLCVWPRCE